MAEDSKMDVDRLLECYARGVSRRHENREHPPHKIIKARDRTPLGTIASDLNDVKTPTRKEHGADQYVPGHSSALLPWKKSNSNGKLISPGVFYGSPLGKPPTKPPQFLRLLNDIRRDLARDLAPQKEYRDAESLGAFTQKATARSLIWATFPRQEQAIQFCESNSNQQQLAVFQYQDHLNGQRRFLATTYAELWNRYKGMIADHRHHYELIQEGKPCHLYFDLEFNRKANSGNDGESMVDVLLNVVEMTFGDVYGLKYDSSWTIELDSSTGEKFSRHLIVRVPHAAFKNNAHAGEFVGEVCKRISHGRETNEDMNCLFVLHGESRIDCHTEIFVDRAVYSRNRSFRLPFSSKAGKTARLLPTKRFRCKNLGEMQVFMDSLICQIDEKCERLLTFDQEDRGHGGTLDFKNWKDQPADPRRGLPFRLSGKSPFPALDTFVESVACIGGVPGKIRSWYWFSEYGVLVYNISDNHFCENIGRPHKSNNVMYIVDFRTAGYYQKCHDPDCRGYRSPLRPIPRHTIPSNYPLSSVPQAICQQQEQEGESPRQEEQPPQQEIELRQDGENCDRRFYSEEWDDESWWNDVVSSLSSLECLSQSQNPSQISVMDEDANNEEDDDWWSIVERELLELEKKANASRSFAADGTGCNQLIIQQEVL